MEIFEQHYCWFLRRTLELRRKRLPNELCCNGGKARLDLSNSPSLNCLNDYLKMIEQGKRGRFTASGPKYEYLGAAGPQARAP